MLRLRRQKAASAVALFLTLLLVAATGGCGGSVSVLGTRANPRERLVIYERDGYVLAVEASGEKERVICKTRNLALGPPAPDGRRVAVLTGVSNGGEWKTGYAAVLDMKGRIRPVVGPRGAFAVELDEMAWLGESLVLTDLESVWIAVEDGDVYRAKAVYTVKSGGDERVWNPRAVKATGRISFWITSNEGDESRVLARLVMLPASGGMPRVVFSRQIWAGGETPGDVIWSQDGRYALIYCKPADGGNCWWLMDVKTGITRGVLSPEAGDIQWLPGSRTALVYAPRAALQVPEYEVLDVLTGKKHPFTGIPNWVTWLEVSPDGKELLLARARGTGVIRYDLYTAAIDGSGIKRIAEGVGEAFWQP